MRSSALLVAALVLVTVTGCVPDSPAIVPAPEPTAAPLFASDEEALAAAEEAYRRYQATEDIITNEGGAQPERITAVATRDALGAALEGFTKYAETETKTIGSTGFYISALQSVDPNSNDGIDVIVVYLCLDLSALDVVDSSGVSVVSPDRPSTQPFEVGFDALNDRSLGVSSRVPWAGGGVCEE